VKFSFITKSHISIDQIKLDDKIFSKKLSSIHCIFIYFVALSEIYNFESSQEKLIVLTNYFAFLLSLLASSELENDRNLLIKLVVYSIIQGFLSRIKSNYKFIRNFRVKYTITSEEDYYLDVLGEAIDFIESLENPDAQINLNINEHDFTVLVNESNNISKCDNNLQNLRNNSMFNFLLF